MENLKEKFSQENIKNELISLILKEFGENHNIKLALFKPLSQYNDESDDYNPILILLDGDHNEIKHNIRLWKLCPNQDEQFDYYEETGVLLEMDDITIKF